MSLATQISLITVPQEFMRLCDALFAAEYGDDYLPIDDDQADRGNDGYLKSEKRLFAAHCFKRVQNQSIENAIRNKMIGDLGKAITLKREGIWDISSWTFVCNYKVSEVIARRVLKIGRDADVDVSWRGPDELAGGLLRHITVLDQFPQLQAYKISDQLTDIQDMLGALSATADDDAVIAISLLRVPRTPEEQRHLLLSRPPAWEYLLFASVLCQGLAGLEGKWRDHELRLRRGPRLHFDTVVDASRHLSNAFDDIGALWGPMENLFSPAAQAQAFGAPGQPGDAARIEHFAQFILAMYEQALDWAANMRNLDVPEPIERSVELASQFVDRPLEEIRRFINRTVSETDRVPAHLAQPEPEPLTIELSLVVSTDDELNAEFHAELKRATREVSQRRIA